jgi:hypothetical protein
MANTLQTDSQMTLEKLALRIAASADVRAARELARSLLLNDATAQTMDGANGLDRALDQWLMGQVVAVVNNDPSRPKLFWAVDNTPRQWQGQIFPGAAVAIDNPDNVNRTAALDGRWSYRLTGQYGSPAVAQTSINVTDAVNGQLRMGEALGTLTNQTITADANGKFTITLDKQTASGRENHIQLREGALQLAIRDSHADWAQQATAFTLEVVNGPALLTEKSESQLAKEAAAGLHDFVAYWLGFKNNFWETPPYNTLVGPLKRKAEGGWGSQAGGRFKLASDEALVVVTESGAADYAGFQISDPWTISPTPVYLTTSRNLAQSTANHDGSYTYVISIIDPGVANWINTAGLHEGWFMLRWQNLPETSPVESLVKKVVLTHLGALEEHLPKGTAQADLALRQKEISQRIALHNQRSN